MKLKIAAVAVIAAVAAVPLFGIGVPHPSCAAGPKQPPVSFKDDVLPVFEVRCASCHHAPDGQGFQASGLDLTSFKGVMTGTKYGPMVVPGDPDRSNLMALIDWRAASALRMPHNKKQLSSCDRDAIRTWIRQGAHDN
jgi:mono/diheme cytochrome c family protein